MEFAQNYQTPFLQEIYLKDLNLICCWQPVSLYQHLPQKILRAIIAHKEISRMWIGTKSIRNPSTVTCPIPFSTQPLCARLIALIWTRTTRSHVVKFHENAYWQKVMSLFHGQYKLSPDLNIYRNCMGFFSSVKI